MNITLKFDTKGIDWKELANLIHVVQLGFRDPEQLRNACENSYIICFAYDDNRLIGTGRVISDGVYHAALFDLAVLPDYQGKGIGKSIVEAIHNRLPETVFETMLFSKPGKELFYEKCQYHKLITGMIRPKNVDLFRKIGHIE